MPLDKEIGSEKQSWKGMLYDTGLTIPSGIYSLITLKNDQKQSVVSVNDESKTVETTSPIKTNDYLLEEENLTGQEYLLFDSSSHSPS